MKTNTTTATTMRKLSKMNSMTLLKKLFNGALQIDEASIAAKIVERRFPTPPVTRG